MDKLDKITLALFTGSSPAIKFLLCVAVYILLTNLQNKIKSKMDEIAIRHDPSLAADNPFVKILLQNREVWTDPEWRELRTKHTTVELLSIVPLISGAFFGFDSLILVIGIFFNW